MIRATLTVEQLSKFLQLSKDTIRKHLREGRLPGRKIGKSWRVDRNAIRAFVGGSVVQN